MLAKKGFKFLIIFNFLYPVIEKCHLAIFKLKAQLFTLQISDFNTDIVAQQGFSKNRRKN